MYVLYGLATAGRPTNAAVMHLPTYLYMEGAPAAAACLQQQSNDYWEHRVPLHQPRLCAGVRVVQLPGGRPPGTAWRQVEGTQ